MSQTIPAPPKRIGEYLLEAGYLSPAQLAVALHDQTLTGLRLGEVLMLRGWIDARTLDLVLHRQIRSRLYALLQPDSKSSSIEKQQDQTLCLQCSGEP